MSVEADFCRLYLCRKCHRLLEIDYYGKRKKGDKNAKHSYWSDVKQHKTYTHYLIHKQDFKDRYLVIDTRYHNNAYNSL